MPSLKDRRRAFEIQVERRQYSGIPMTAYAAAEIWDGIAYITRARDLLRNENGNSWSCAQLGDAVQALRDMLRDISDMEVAGESRGWIRPDSRVMFNAETHTALTEEYIAKLGRASQESYTFDVYDSHAPLFVRGTWCFSFRHFHAWLKRRGASVITDPQLTRMLQTLRYGYKLRSVKVSGMTRQRWLWSLPA